MMGMRDSIAGVAELLRWCDENGTLASTYQQCTDLSTRCRDQNDRNGALVTARLNHVSNMLGMLNVGGREGRTYGANATNNAAPALAGRLLATSA
jgi:flagellar biosynthesis/type III secretory pathway chaperone